jgi:hypothetical protein
MKKTIGIVCLLAGLMLAGCSTKWGPVDTTVTVYVNVQTRQTPPDTIYTADWLPFYAYGDTTRYELTSYENALAGTLTSIGGGNTPPVEKGEVPDDKRVIFPNLAEKSVILWVVQPGTRMYAWRQVDLVDGLPDLNLRLFFRTWANAPAVENKWNIVFPPAPEVPEEPETQPE